MSKEEAKIKILEIMDFLDNGEVEFYGNIYKGHPGFYFFHTKEEMLKKLDENLNKEIYDRYDIYYICNKLIKFLLSKYDSHTTVEFMDEIVFPITFKVIKDKIYIENISNKKGNYIGYELTKVNGVDIDTIKNEIESISCYSTKGYLEYKYKVNLRKYYSMSALPCIDRKTETINYEIKSGNIVKHIIFNKNEKDEDYKFKKDNYQYCIIDNIMILTYNACHDSDKMKQFVEEIKNVSLDNNINCFIVDIRENRGGNSEIINPLLDFLKGKNIVTLVNETTFSAARMAFTDLKQLGSYSIGTTISTSINCFGNNCRVKYDKELGLMFQGSTRYFNYDKDLHRSYIQEKQDFEDYYRKHIELLEPWILEPDEIVYITLDDIKNGTDSQLERAIEYIKENKLSK